MTSKRLIGIAKAAELLGVGISTLRAWDDSGALKAEVLRAFKKIGFTLTDKIKRLPFKDNSPLMSSKKNISQL